MAGSLHDMKTAAVVDDDRPGQAELEALLDRRIAKWWRGAFLLVAGLAGGAGGAVLIAPDEEPPAVIQPSPERVVTCECGGSSEQEIAECRLAADYARQAALAVGVDEHTLERVARDVLGTPPDP